MRHAKLGSLLLTIGVFGVAPLYAQTTEAQGVLFRLGGDVDLPAGERTALVAVVDGDARVAGRTDVLVVVRGRATVRGGSVGTLVAISGDVRLEEGATVEGDIELVRSTLDRAEGARVLGRVEEGADRHAAAGAWFFGLFVALGVAAMALVAGLVAAAVAPEGVRRVQRALVSDLKGTLIAAALIWIALPVVGVALIPTLIGLPAGFGIFIFVLPTLGFLGYVLAGTALGEAILRSRANEAERTGPPFTGALLGIALLLVGGLLPILGPMVAPLAGAVGSGALVAVLWRSARRPPAAA